MEIPDSIRLPAQAIFAVAESVWKRVFDHVMGMILLAGSGLAFLLGSNIEGNEFHVALVVIQVFVSLLVILIGTTEIPRDMATRNIQFFLSKPLGRGGYIMGKFVGVLILGELILVAYVACFVVGATIHGFGNGRELMVDGIRMILQLAALSALLVGLSVIFPEVAATIFGVAFYIASFLSFILPSLVRQFLPEWISPLFLSVYYLVPNSYYYLWALGDVPLGSFLLLLGAYSVAYCSMALMVANFWFQRRDLN